MGISRRSAFKVFLTATGTAVAARLGRKEAQAAVVAPPPDALGMLYDNTRCIGCKACMVACNKANDLPPDTKLSDGLWQMPLDLNGQTKNIIKLYNDPKGGYAFVKRQCMHCVDPACATACMLGALQKREFGIVSYDPSLCIGCRYCEMACPFTIPKFEWSSLAPLIVKCELCRHRIDGGKGPGPACCEVCPTAAVVYGKRDDLLKEAHRRIDQNPKRYLPKVYGEHEVGGTQVLYLSNVEFEKLGLPAYDDKSVPETVRNVQHTVYKGFVAPVALYGVASGLMLRRRKIAEAGGPAVAPGVEEHEASPMPGRIFSPGVLALAVLAVIGFALIVWRFAVGLGASTAMNDGYAWGLWIAFDVVTGTALGCGGYAMAMLVYLLNRGRYHPLIRPALVTSAFGYTIAAFSVMLDVGRPWLAWKIPLFFWHWNLNSVLLEVALCIMAYMTILWIELMPAFLEWARGSSIPIIRRIGEMGLPVMRRSLLWIVGLGILLPTMHQSSLGALMLLSGPRLNSLWNTPVLPLLFLISVIAMGYGAVVIEATLSAQFLTKRSERDMLAGVGGAMVPLLSVYLVVRIADLVIRGQLPALFAFDLFSILSLIEIALFAAALLSLSTDALRRDTGNLFRAAILMLLSGAMYRFDTFLVAFRPGEHWSYFPNVTEILVTSGLVAAEIVGYVIMVRFFPILAGAEPAAEKTK